MKTWTADDIQLMKEDFLKGLSIKKIAMALGRTPSATNKALSRFGIRQSRMPRQELEQWDSFDNEETNHFSSPRDKIRKINKEIKKKENINLRLWVDMDVIETCIKQNGHKIALIEKNQDPTETLYQLDGKLTTALKVVFLANRYRVEASQPPFYVEEITW